MTWKPTKEMIEKAASEFFKDAQANLPTDLAIAVQPDIAAEARAKALGEANEAVYQALKYGNPWPAVEAIEALNARSLIPKPAEPPFEGVEVEDYER